MKEKSLNIEEVLHIGNKKVKQLRDVRQALWAYINDDELIPKDLNLNVIKPYLDRLDEDDIVPSDEPVSEYSTLKLEEITRLLENYL